MGTSYIVEINYLVNRFIVYNIYVQFENQRADLALFWQVLILCSVLIQSCSSRGIGIPISQINDDPEPQDLYPYPDFSEFWSNPRSLG